MPLKNLVTGDVFTPILKFNAKSGRFSVRQGEQDVEITKLRVAVDFEHIRLGWIRFNDDAAPDKVFDPDLETMAPKPAGDGWKRGFELYMFGPDNLPGIGILGLREFMSTAGATCAAIRKAYEKYEEGRAANPSKVPAFMLADVIPIKGHYGTNYEPVFNLVTWVERERVPALSAQITKQLTATTARGLLAPKSETPWVDAFVTGRESQGPKSAPDEDEGIPF